MAFAPHFPISSLPQHAETLAYLARSMRRLAEDSDKLEAAVRGCIAQQEEEVRGDATVKASSATNANAAATKVSITENHAWEQQLFE